MADRTFSASSKRTRPTSDDVIGNFVIDKEIGKGSFAQVYSGRHKVSSTPGCSVADEPRELGWTSSRLLA